jgi:very-short-patch-repair endonuclease
MEKRRGWDGIYFNKNGKKEQFLIEYLGYFVDYYEPKLNVVVEYDETNHYNSDWSLKEKDIKRQKEIVKYLGCRFYRYNEVLGKMFEVK